MDINTIGAVICEYWIIVLAVCVILFIIIISLAFGKTSSERRLEEKLQELTYEIERLRKESREIKGKRKGGSLKEDIKSVMVTGKSIKGEGKRL